MTKECLKIIFFLLTMISLLGCNDTLTRETVVITQEQQTKEPKAESLQPQYNANIEGIRNAVMKNYTESLTIGQALEGWRECKNPEWKSKVGDRGENLVIFKCELQNPKYYSNSNIVNAQYALLFSNSVDGSKFKPESNALIFTFNDGKTFTYERDNLTEYAMNNSMVGSYGNSLIDNLINIYENKEVFPEVSSTERFYEKRE